MSEIIQAHRPPGFTRDYILDKWTYELPAAAIPAEQIKQVFNTEVLVVGAGTSGKAAALSAAEVGASVIQIDRHTTFRWSGGHIGAIDSRVQKKLGIKVDKDAICLELMRWGGNHPDQRFYRLWAENSGAVMDWVMDMTDPEGIQTLIYQWPRPAAFDLKTEYYPEYPVTHWQNDGTNILNHSLSLKQLEKHARRRGADIRYEVRALQLIRNENGRVTGLLAKDKGGNFLQFNARKAVILCTGDYGNNPRLMRQYCPVAADIALENNIYMTRNEDLRAAQEPLDTGDGHQMAMRVGAVMEPGPHAPMAHATAGPLGNASFLRVNLFGERYENEDVPAQNIANSLTRQYRKSAWQVFDSKWEKELPLMGVGLGKFIEANEKAYVSFKATNISADTLEGLARKIDVPVKTFLATVERYNQMVRAGRDTDFGKTPRRLTSIDTPPFFAGPSKQEFLVVLGGLNTNLRMQPLDAERRAIPGLYVAGNLVGNRFAVDYPTMCSGLSHGLAYLTGRLAGQYAAGEKG